MTLPNDALEHLQNNKKVNSREPQDEAPQDMQMQRNKWEQIAGIHFRGTAGIYFAFHFKCRLKEEGGKIWEIAKKKAENCENCRSYEFPPPKERGKQGTKASLCTVRSNDDVHLVEK